MHWTARNEWSDQEAYGMEHPVRNANDLAFQTAILNLFHKPPSWDSKQTFYLKLNLALLRRRRGRTPEPRAEDWDIAGEYCWDCKTRRAFSDPLIGRSFSAMTYYLFGVLRTSRLNPMILAGAIMVKFGRLQCKLSFNTTQNSFN